jgi:membrane protein
MNDLLFMISMSLSVVLPVIALAISVLIERRLDKRKTPFFGLFFPIMLCLTIYEYGLIKFQDPGTGFTVVVVLLFFCYPLLLIALLYSGIRLYLVYKDRVWKVIGIVSYYLVASWFVFCTPNEHFITNLSGLRLQEIAILIGIFLPSLYLYLDKDQQFQVSHSHEGVKDEN